LEELDAFPLVAGAEDAAVEALLVATETVVALLVAIETDEALVDLVLVVYFETEVFFVLDAFVTEAVEAAEVFTGAEETVELAFLVVETLAVETLVVGALEEETLAVETLAVEALVVETLAVDALVVAALEVETLTVEALVVEILAVDALVVGALEVETFAVEALVVEALAVDALVVGALEVEETELAFEVTFLVELALEEVFTGAEETELTLVEAAELVFLVLDTADVTAELVVAGLLTEEAVGLLDEVVFLVGG